MSLWRQPPNLIYETSAGVGTASSGGRFPRPRRSEKIAMLHSDVRARAEFRPIRAENSERVWRVRATFSSGKTIDIGEFNAEQAALEWIALKSAEWLELLKCERNLHRTGL